MTDLGDKLKALRQKAIDEGMVPGEAEMTNPISAELQEIARLLSEDKIACRTPDVGAIAQLHDIARRLTVEPKCEPFVVKHYTSDERPSIKGNGFDGLEVGTDREDAEDFVRWLNERLGVNRGAKP